MTHHTYIYLSMYTVYIYIYILCYVIVIQFLTPIYIYIYIISYLTSFHPVDVRMLPTLHECFSGELNIAELPQPPRPSMYGIVPYIYTPHV